MARPKKATTDQADNTEVQKEQEVKSPYVNDAAKEYFERTFLNIGFKVHVDKALYKRTCTREGSQNPISYVSMSAKVAPPKTEEYRYDAICTGGDNARDIFNGADAQNYKAEKEQYLAKVNQAFE